MKSLNLFTVIFLLLASCSSSQDKSATVIKGKIKHESAGTQVYLEEVTYTNRNAIDTAQLDKQGDFLMKPLLKNQGLYQLRIGESRAIFLVLDEKPAQVILNADTASIRNYSYTIKGAPASEQLRQFISSIQKYGEAFGSAMKEYGLMVNDSTPDSIRQLYVNKLTIADSNFRTFARNYVDTVKNPIIGIFAVSNLDFNHDKATFEKLEQKLKKDYAHIPFAQTYFMMMEDQKAASQQNTSGSKFKEGETVPDFEMADIQGKSLKLSSVKGKVVLLDFWASWCGPCRKENPTLVRAYQKYRDKGFTIFSVSLDNDREKWVKAISKDQLEWSYHVSQLRGWQSPICEVYGIRSIPQSYLLDKEGKIIAVNLRGSELDLKLSEILY